MSKKLSFSIAVNLLTENFKKGASAVKHSLRSMQMQVITFAAALGASGLGLSGMISRFKDVARETNQVMTALKNVSAGTKGFADNLRFLNNLSNKYGQDVNGLISEFSKFTASATQANMSIEEQMKTFEAFSRSTSAFALSTDSTKGVFLALTQMMGKGKISMEELRKQMGEKLPIAVQAMANALGVSVAQMEKLVSTGKVMSADILPKFADELNKLTPNVDTDNLETSLGRLKNVFSDVVNSSGFLSGYKTLVDGLASLLKSAAKNVSNIIIAAIMAISFAIANSIRKTYANYVNSGNQIIAHTQKTEAQLRAAVEARVLARKRLNDLIVQHDNATGQQQIRIAQRVEDAKTAYSSKTAAARLALNNHVEARTNASAIKASGMFGRMGAMVIGQVKKIGLAIKSAFSMFAFGAIISLITGFIAKTIAARKELNRIKNIYSDYKKEVESVGNTDEVKKLQAQLSIMNDKTRSQKEANAAQRELQKMLGKENLSQDEINRAVAKRIKLIKEAAKADYYAAKSVETEDVIKTKARDVGISDDQLKELARKKSAPAIGAKVNYWSMLNESAGISGSIVTKKQVNQRKRIDKAVTEVIEILKVFDDANEAIGTATNTANLLTTDAAADLDDSALSAAEKRLEALRKLDSADRKRQIDKQKFDLDLEQKEIDQMDDSFEKRTRQTLINLKKEKLAVEEFQADLLKDQENQAKDKYVSIHGTDKGFEAYFPKLKQANFKSSDGSDLMPEGLRPEDISRQVNLLLQAAEESKVKGLKDINKDYYAMLAEQRMMFASELEKRLFDIDKFYNEERIKAGNNAELLRQIEENRTREKQGAKAEDQLKRIDFSEQYELERVSGLESIGMTELVEKKKLEITKRYLQLRIEALQSLAEAGDIDAQRSTKLYEAELNSLNLEKPAKTLKSLADKAIFTTISKGFIKAGDSADKANEKTVNLLGSIAQNAGLVESIAGGMQSMFGGMSSDLDEALSAVGNIASGFAQGGILGGAMAVVGEGMKLFSKASEAEARHQRALKEIADSKLASQRAYNLLLLEQNLLLKEATTIFGEKQIQKAANAIENYRKSISDLKKEMQGSFLPDKAIEKELERKSSKGGLMSGYYQAQLKEYKKQAESYKKGIAGLANAKIVTGHKKTGLFGWGKGKDLYSSILDIPEYKDLIKDGKLDIDMAKVILDTRKMSDETRAYIQNLINLQEHAEAAQDALRDYLQSTFGSLGDGLMDSIEAAIKDRGVNAWKSFGEAGSKVIEQLGKQLAYELFFAERFKGLQNQLEEVYGSGKSEKEIAKDAMNLVGDFYKNIGSQMELAQGFMENWKKEAEKYGLELWKPEEHTQDTSRGYSTSMTQETGGALLGMTRGIHEVGLKIESLLKDASINSSRQFAESAAVSSELVKQTDIFNDMKQVQQTMHFNLEAIKDGIEPLADMKKSLAKIEKNTNSI